jgi:hypothetical protein
MQIVVKQTIIKIRLLQAITGDAFRKSKKTSKNETTRLSKLSE